jgi:NAD(P)-dependent dehydrogenase (short-subunit alcohol dehydrogenase family)
MPRLQEVTLSEEFRPAVAGSPAHPMTTAAGSAVELNGRRILVTGADGTGVGRGVCDSIVAGGGRLVVHGYTRQSAEQAAQRWPGCGVVWGDVSDEAQAEAFVTAALDAFDGLDGLVNNAGVGLSREFFDASAAEFDWLYAVDVRGTWLTSRAVTRAWRELPGPGRSIVNVSSVNSLATLAGYALYAGAKAAINGLTRGMAVELGRFAIRCNAIAPGYVASEQGVELLGTLSDDPAHWAQAHISDQQAIAEPVNRADCGHLTAFLLSAASTGITGQVISVDNGTTSLLYNRGFTKLPAGSA